MLIGRPPSIDRFRELIVSKSVVLSFFQRRVDLAGRCLPLLRIDDLQYRGLKIQVHPLAQR